MDSSSNTMDPNPNNLDSGKSAPLGSPLNPINFESIATSLSFTMSLDPELTYSVEQVVVQPVLPLLNSSSDTEMRSSSEPESSSPPSSPMDLEGIPPLPISLGSLEIPSLSSSVSSACRSSSPEPDTPPSFSPDIERPQERILSLGSEAQQLDSPWSPEAPPSPAPEPPSLPSAEPTIPQALLRLLGQDPPATSSPSESLDPATTSQNPISGPPSGYDAYTWPTTDNRTIRPQFTAELSVLDNGQVLPTRKWSLPSPPTSPADDDLPSLHALHLFAFSTAPLARDYITQYRPHGSLYITQLSLSHVRHVGITDFRAIAALADVLRLVRELPLLRFLHMNMECPSHESELEAAFLGREIEVDGTPGFLGECVEVCPELEVVELTGRCPRGRVRTLCERMMDGSWIAVDRSGGEEDCSSDWEL